MDELKSIEEIRNLVARVRNRRIGFVTNFYLDENKHGIWIRKGDFFYDIIGDTLFLIRKSEHICNLFYNSISVESLRKDLDSFKSRYPDLTSIMDIVGRKTQCEQLTTSLGLTEITSFVRMYRFSEPLEYVDDSTVSKASFSEVREIYDLLHSFFDEETEQIPYLEELEEYAGLGHIIVCREDGRLAGFIIYETNATTLYFRYWFTHPDFRERKVGSRLFRRSFEEGRNTKRQILWVIRTNENAMKRYRHYGFKEEDMFDYVIKLN